MSIFSKEYDKFYKNSEQSGEKLVFLPIHHKIKIFRFSEVLTKSYRTMRGKIIT